MKELSLNILDIVQNSISADASLIDIDIIENTINESMIISISDNGRGMSEEFLKTVTDPFVTTRTTRKVGLGISLFKLAAECTGGTFKISSELGKGTKIEAGFVVSHIDMMPLGNISQTISALVGLNPSIDFNYRHTVNDSKFEFSSAEIKERLGDIPIDSPEIVLWISKYIKENIDNLYGGADI